MDTYLVVNILAGLLIITSLLVVLVKSARTTALFYALQSLVLVSTFLALSYATGSEELLTWAATAFATKVVLTPMIMLIALRKISDPTGGLPRGLSPIFYLGLVALELFLCFLAVGGIELPASAEVKPALAISLAHFFAGLTCIITQRNIYKQVFGYCLMENGSHLTLALLAPSAPSLVEIGIATDAIFAVVIMAIIVTRIYRATGSLDADKLKQLKG
jgi:hydrogenase-4 component E